MSRAADMSVKAELLTSPLALKFRDSLNGLYDGGFVRITPSGCVQPAHFMSDLQSILDFKVRPDDVWVVTFPKSGTTWTQEMVWLLMNELNFEVAQFVPLVVRFPFLESSFITPLSVKREPSALQIISNTESPRLIKSHLPMELLPKQLWTVKPKIIYVTRNVKDVIVSYYNHFRLWIDCTLALDEFAECFIGNVATSLPFWEHILPFWKLRNEPNILFLKFEDMKRDLPGIVTRAAEFLGKSVPDDKLPQLLDHLSFQKMRSNRAVNFLDQIAQQRREMGLPPLQSDQAFMRRGTVGDGSAMLSPALQRRLEDWTEACLQGSDYDGPR